jgi:branched-chain amino acid transport system substrate-binding protein
MSKRVSWTVVAAATIAVVLVGAAVAARSTQRTAAAKKPIVIGAVVDLTKNMAPFDAPAVAAAQIEIKKINAAGGVLGRKLELKVFNDQLDPQRTKQGAVQFLSQGADVIWVTCDVDYASPAVKAALDKKKLAIAPCIGTDEMSPLRFGSEGKLAFSFGNAAQDEGAAMAQYAIKRGWKQSVVVTDNLLRYFKDVCKAFTVRYRQLGGKVLSQESFTQGDKTIGNVATRVNNERSAKVIAFCTSFAGDQPAFVSSLRSLGNKTPIFNSWAGDGAYWWPKSPKVTNYYFVTYASAFGDDPSKQVRSFEKLMTKAGHPAQTGGFITGATAIQTLAYAIKKAHGSTNGAKLASILVKLHKFPTISGKISFSPALHSVFGRSYRVIEVNNNKAKVVGEVTAKSPAKIH